VAHDLLAPVVLGPNQPDGRPYRGGAGIARLRGIAQTSEFTPEDFVASTTEVFGGGAGLTVLPNGRTLLQEIADDPTGYLGAVHVARFGADPALLVKLLHTGERLFVHFHPDAAFASAHFGLERGKTEAWIVVATEGDACAYLGFTRDVDEVEVQRWVAEQDIDAMLDAMNRVELRPGDTLFVPATLPHAIGSGVTLVELQEPVDLSILLEYRGFNGLTAQSALLGLDQRTALADLDRREWDAQRLATLTASRAGADTGTATGTVRAAATSLFPEAADVYFRAERLRVDGGAMRLDAGFSIIVVLDGSGVLTTDVGSLDLVVGMTVLIPFSAGAVELAGSLEAIRCMPPR